MSTRTQLTRREFFRVASVAVPAVLLGACAPKLVPETDIPVTPSAAPTKENIDPVVPEMLLIKAGSCDMGSTDGYPDEQPVRTTRITKPFLMGRYEVTFDEYDRFCRDRAHAKPDDGGHGRGRVPVWQVDWYDAVAYCNWLSEKERLSPCYKGSGRSTMCDFSAEGYRLPTETEWEYTARGGPKSQGCAYAGNNNPYEVGWYEATSDGHPH